MYNSNKICPTYLTYRYVGTVRLLNSDKMFSRKIILSQLFIESTSFFLQKIFCAFILSCVFTAFSLVLLTVLLFADS